MRPRGGARGVFAWRVPIITIIIPVLTPFVYITCHIVDAEFVRLFCGYRMRFLAIIPCHITQFVASAVFIPFAVLAATSRILPFGLCRQTEFLSRQLAELGDKRLAVIPRHRLHREVVSREVGRILAHYSLPKCLGHFRLPDIVAAQRHGMNRALAIGKIISHLERAARYGFHHEGDTFHRKGLVCLLCTHTHRHTQGEKQKNGLDFHGIDWFLGYSWGQRYEN